MVKLSIPIRFLQKLIVTLTSSLAKPAPMLRIAVSTLLFTTSIVMYAHHRYPILAIKHDLIRFREITNGRYTMRLENFESDSNIRIATIGSSEMIDYKHRRDPEYSLGIAIEELTPQYFDAPVEVIERAFPMLSLSFKRDSLRKAIELESDLVIISIPFSQLQHSRLQEFLHEPSPDSDFLLQAKFWFLARLHSPLHYIHKEIDAKIPSYKLSLNHLIHQKQPVQQERVIGFTQQPRTRTDEATTPIDETEDRPITLPKTTFFREEEPASSDDLYELFVKLSEPVRDKNSTLIILMSPCYNDQTEETLTAYLEESSLNIDKAAQQIGLPNVIVLNEIINTKLDSSDYNDSIHIRNHHNLIPGMFEKYLESTTLPDIQVKESRDE